MSVELLPSSTLGFHRPLNLTTKRTTLTIHNPHSSPVAFKVKTTAPRQYSVRPTSGRVEPGEHVEVTVLLSPLHEEPPPHAKCKDKFLVQSAFISPDDEMVSLTEMWEKTDKSKVFEQKVKCAYLAAEDGSNGNAIPEEEESAASPDQSRFLDESQIYTAAESGPVSPHSATESTNGATKAVPSTAVPVTAQPPAASKSTTIEPPLPDLTANAIAETKGSSATDAALEKSLSATTSDSEKLKVALAEIERLRSQLTEAQGPQVTGLRKRGGASSSGADTAVEKAKEVVAAAQGVPIEVVGGLLFAVFVLTYLFF